MDWKIEFSRNVIKDAQKLKSANLDSNLKSLLEILKHNPYAPPYEKLSGNLKGYSQDASTSNIDWFMPSMKKLKLLELFLCGHIMNSKIWRSLFD